MAFLLWIWEYLLSISWSVVFLFPRMSVSPLVIFPYGMSSAQRGGILNYVGLNYWFYRSYFVLKYRNLWSMKTIGYFSYLVAYFSLLVEIVFESFYTSHSIQLMEYYCLFWIFLNSMRVLCYNPIVPESFSNWYPWVRWRVLCCRGM